MAKMISLFGFASLMSSEAVKEFLELHTGEGTVSNVEVGQKEGSRAHAIVEFTTVEAAELIKGLAAERLLWYGKSYLKASDEKRRIPYYKLNFGCQISKDKFSVLWSQENVSVKLCSDLRKFMFFLSYASVDYKLELSYESIWQIELHRPRGHSVKYLVIQLYGAPMIYEKDIHWVREVDFTPSSSIGQSSAMCLELPRGAHIPKALKDFFYYKESPLQFTLVRGSGFSSNTDLVPMISPPHGIKLPFKILFKINSLVQHGCIPGPALDAKFFRLVDPSRIKMECIDRALETLFHLRNCCYEPVSCLEEQYTKYVLSGRLLNSPAVALDDGLVYVNKVLVTPSKVYFCGPEISLSNRVLRSYPDEIDNFLRLSFVDEDLDKLYSTVLSPVTSSTNEERHTRIYERVLSTLRNGIVIGDKKFETLAFSNSQVKDNSLWMFASRPELTAADIRERMGDFRDIKNVAKYAARLGQSFSSSREALHVDSSDIEIIPDVEVEDDGITYCFSDGIGKISAELAEIVAKNCGFTIYTPSAFQIRYGGYKGVVAVDPTSSTKLSLRKSMLKYKSESTSLDILANSKYQPCFLNRQLITLLSTLGIRDRVFEKKQREGVAQLDAILTDPLKAHEALELMSSGENTNVLKEMLMCGYKPDVEPFLSMMLHTFRASNLLELRTRTRIFIQNGRAMMGCLDETGTLEYGQVFVQCSASRRREFLDNSCNNRSGELSVVEGKVVVAKNPCLHPGDMRVLRAVDVPALHHMVDCVVFPAKGKRPHTNECSGSDLDGDVYFVCWDHELIPPLQFRPMDYTPAPEKVLDRDVTIEDVEEYFADYIVNDSLGIICNAHVVHADSEPDKARSSKCLELAKLSSIAVDFSKTGVAATIPSGLRVKKYPDFMEKQNKTCYESQRVIGKLYREVKGIAPSTATMKSFTKEVAMQSYDTDMEVDGFKHYIIDAFNYKTEYVIKLGNLMDYYGIKTEAEILSGCIMEMAKSFDKKRDLEAITFAVRSLRKEARTWFNKKKNESDSSHEAVYAKASAWYHVTYHPSYWGRYKREGMNRDHFLSFPWCIHDKLIEIKRGKQSS
ncbi:probable RNA-dependent RNA polymerase 1 [Citrus clementina]|uniref:probable RNA-dependent RNA polymerase 1 n=1 Tax=Citrus clementina TaxID=85681 RepID=UPI000CED60A0|nr:probable RNA-dependent RNA polymerase 1 [Citrus x clementina]